MTLYRLLTDLTAPLIALYLRLRKRKGREDKERFRERLGQASTSRPHGKLVWCHASSVGEAMSVLTLVTHLRQRHSAWNVLLTTGTVTSAKLLSTRLPAGVIHQYVPVDRWPYVMRFLNHWKPDLALWVESELWPNMLGALKERAVPTILLNGRMSEKSYRRWRLMPGGAKEMMNAFVLGFAQTGAERNRFASLGLKNVHQIGNLKYAADPLPCDEAELSRLKTALGNRPLWLMTSTHPGEEEIALRVHHALRLAFPDILTIIVPRHPERKEEIVSLFKEKNLSYACRSEDNFSSCLSPARSAERSIERGNAPLTVSSQTELYLADTMGELGLFYRLSKICCLAGSFSWGGHNPIEPAQLGCAVVFGPRMENFALMADDMLGHEAAIQVTDEKELEEVLLRLLHHPNEALMLSGKAREWTEEKRGILEETLRRLDPFFTESQKANP